MTSPSWFITNWPEVTRIHDGCTSLTYYRELWSYKLFFKIIYILIYFIFAALGLHCFARAFSSCSAWASPCCGSPCCGALALGTQASEVVARGLSCFTACGIFPDQGSNRSHLHWQVDSYPLSHQGCPWVLLRTENLSKVFSGKQKCLQFGKILGKSDSLIGCNFKACLHDLFFFFNTQNCVTYL